MQMKDLASSCRGGGEGAPGPCHRDRLPRQGPYISHDDGPGSTLGARAAQEDGRAEGGGRAGVEGPGCSSRADRGNSGSKKTPVGGAAPRPDPTQGSLWQKSHRARNGDKLSDVPKAEWQGASWTRSRVTLTCWGLPLPPLSTQRQQPPPPR